MPVDLYVGGAEHAVLHLLYARFWHKVLYDLGLVHTQEPFQKLLNPGMILGVSFRYYDDNLADDPGARPRRFAASAVRVEGERVIAAATGRRAEGALGARRTACAAPRTARPSIPTTPTSSLEEVVEKMSKSRGNVVNPDDVVAQYGADTLRLYELFMGPLEKGAPWSTEGIPGCFRFLQRIWRLFADEDAPGEPTVALAPGARHAGAGAPHRAHRSPGVTRGRRGARPQHRDREADGVDPRRRQGSSPAPRRRRGVPAAALALRAPPRRGALGAHRRRRAASPSRPGPRRTRRSSPSRRVRIVVQVNGKKRDDVEVAASADEAALRAAALASERVQAQLQGRAPRKVIVVPGRLVNVVV